MVKSNPKPPEHLSATAKRLWAQILTDYSLELHHTQLLQAACEQLTRAEQARKQIKRDGLTIVDRFGQTKSHPAVEIERQSQLAFLRLLRELGLDVEVSETRGPRRAGSE